MSVDIDFSSIRPWNGDKRLGFEELCCQLAMLENPEEGVEFERKEGAGGDAGVECLWRMEDDLIHGWQAKYFTGQLTPQRWGQIDDSVRTAIERHPRLVKYTLCLPKNLTDRRLEEATSERPTLQHRVERWKGWAEEEGRQINFEFWGETELGERLTRDTPDYAGRTRFWFDNRSFTHDWFSRRFAEVRKNLGPRYTPELNVELPISKVFDAIGRTGILAQEFSERASRLQESVERLERVVDDPLLSEIEPETAELGKALERLEGCMRSVPSRPDQELALHEVEDAADAARAACQAVRSELDALRNCGDEQEEDKSNRKGGEGSAKQVRRAGVALTKLEGAISSVTTLAASDLATAARTGAMVLTGRAGVGKTHTLANVVSRRVENGLPAVLLLGQHVGESSPWDTFLSELHLPSDMDFPEMLGALDSAGQAEGARALILIDAINESRDPWLWVDRLPGLFELVQRFPHVGVAISCRTSYADRLLQDLDRDSSLLRVEHRGFEGQQARASATYLDRHGIERPNTPILTPEFSNPLFLKTCCRALQQAGATSFPRGLRGVTQIFEFYLDAVERNLRRRLGLPPTGNPIGDALDRLAEEMASREKVRVPLSDACEIIDGEEQPTPWEESLTFCLIDEGVILRNVVRYPEKERGDEVVRFGYDRLGDHLISRKLLEKHANEPLEKAFSPDGKLGEIIAGEAAWRMSGVIQALMIQMPEEFNRELIGVADAVYDEVPRPIAREFLDSVTWRSPESCTEETVDWLNRYPPERVLDVVLKLVAEPEHPLNAERLHSSLKAMEMPERDSLWTEYLAFGHDDEDFGDYTEESPVRTLIDWCWEAEKEDAREETLWLSAVALMWFQAATNRRVRDQATKALVAVLEANLGLACRLLEHAAEVDDLYVRERVLAAVYGAVLQGAEEEELRQAAEAAFETVFQAGEPPPHLLLRDYARGIIEFAADIDLLPDGVDLSATRPPYESPWPLEIPSEEEIERQTDKRKFDPVYSSIFVMGDFGRYILDDVEKWSSTRLTQTEPKTHADVLQKLVERLKEAGADETLSVLCDLIERERSPRAQLQELLETAAESDEFSETSETDLEALKSQPEIGESPDENEGTEAFRQRVLEHLDATETEMYQTALPAIRATGGERPIKFSHEAAKRWVYQRVFDKYGWSAERFEHFERPLQKRFPSRQTSRVERISKKYQWLAYYEILARLADNVHMAGHAWDDWRDTEYRGPWQGFFRDIDPSILVRAPQDHPDYGHRTEVWWRPVSQRFPGPTLEERQEALWSENFVPNIDELIAVQDPRGDRWAVLRTHVSWRDGGGRDSGEVRPQWDFWLRIRSLMVKQEVVENLKTKLTHTDRRDPHEISDDVETKMFAGEYPWHPAVPRNQIGWRECSLPIGREDMASFDAIVPLYRHSRHRERDFSGNEHVQTFHPAPLVMRKLDLRWEGGRTCAYFNNNGRQLYDPGLLEPGPSAGLCRQEALAKLTEEEGLGVIWLVAGEKGLYGPGLGASEFYGRMVIGGLFVLEEGGVYGESWLTEEKPPDKTERK